MEPEACAIVQPVWRKAFLLLAEGHSQHAVGTGAHIYMYQARHLLLPAMHPNPLQQCLNLYVATATREQHDSICTHFNTQEKQIIPLFALVYVLSTL